MTDVARIYPPREGTRVAPATRMHDRFMRPDVKPVTSPPGAVMDSRTAGQQDYDANALTAPAHAAMWVFLRIRQRQSRKQQKNQDSVADDRSARVVRNPSSSAGLAPRKRLSRLFSGIFKSGRG
jgi:hypothetical protein